MSDTKQSHRAPFRYRPNRKLTRSEEAELRLAVENYRKSKSRERSEVSDKENMLQQVTYDVFGYPYGGSTRKKNRSSKKRGRASRASRAKQAKQASRKTRRM